jgi:choline dehydrogenase-like flavoprotein
MTECDLVVVGSGPSGAQAAKQAIDLGCAVTMLDLGIDDPATRDAIPPGGFTDLRRGDPEQWRYFVGDHMSAGDLTGVRVGAQLTPPRQFIVSEAARLLPLATESFAPLQTAALGGLGSGWGAGTYAYSDEELRAVGLPAADMLAAYADVANDIGISAEPRDDTGPEFVRFPVQPPHPLDDNASTLFASYGRRRAASQRLGMLLGRAPSAVLSRPLRRDGLSRGANPLEDMDFYSDASRSVYRPRFTVEELSANRRFRYLGGTLVTEFREDGDRVEIRCREIAGGAHRTLRARRLVLAAGAMATTRIVLRSLGAYDRDVPILSNPYTYLPCVNLSMFGHPAGDRRHSLAQLAGTLRVEGGDVDKVLLSVFSYRSLLLFKLVKEMPLPPQLGLLVARLLLSSLTVVGLHHPERRTPQKVMRLRRRGADEPVLDVSYEQTAAEKAAVARNVRRAFRALTAIRCVPFGAVDPGHGSSIHYAGGLTITSDASDPLGTAASGRLHAAHTVYVADSANWKFLPSKGLTLSLMANARRVVRAVVRDLASGT